MNDRVEGYDNASEEIRANEASQKRPGNVNRIQHTSTSLRVKWNHWDGSNVCKRLSQATAAA